MRNSPNHIKQIAVWGITPNGKWLGMQLKKQFEFSTLFFSKKIWGPSKESEGVQLFDKLSEEIKQQFNHYTGHIFIFSTGIAVRLIAPLLKSKLSDPAVVVVDDNGHHAISLLSGHIGGGNELAKITATIVGGTPVITTATDTNQLPSIDMLAKAANLFIETPENIKHVNMALLQGEKINIQDSTGQLDQFFLQKYQTPVNKTATGGADILCSYNTRSVSRETFVLRPRILSVGIGCNRGTSHEVIKQFLFRTMKDESLSTNSIYRFATTNVKMNEAGITALAEEMGIPVDYYDNKSLNSVKTIQNPSKMAQKHLGVNSVCEAAAILTANNGKLIVCKKKNKDVTIAVAVKI
ncbi:MAG: cobalamin biosynthesis protein [Desulfobacula sp.]|nr:cobalamin biosynthesis protein [Desulfobacula sp.]